MQEGPRTPLEVAKSQDIELGFDTHFEGTLKAEFVLLMLQSNWVVSGAGTGSMGTMVFFSHQLLTCTEFNYISIKETS